MKHFSILLFFFLFTFSASAQYCGNSGPSVCNPVAAPDSTYRIWPTSYMHDCIVRDSFYSTSFTIYNKTDITFSGQTLSVNSIRIDTILNLPCGLCYSTNKVNNIVYHGDSMCVLISGTTHSMAGQYNATILATADLGVPIAINPTDPNDHNNPLWLPLRIQDDQGNCPEVDTFSNGSFVNCNNVGIEEESITQVKASFVGDQLIISNAKISTQVEVFNLQGQLMFQTTVSDTYTKTLPNLQAGLYVVVLSNSAGRKTMRLVKQN